MKKSKPCALIMAGGTGGHVFPALAVAKALQEKGWEIQWLGTQHGLEKEIVTKSGIPLNYITVFGVRRTSFLNKLLAPFQIIRALLQSLKIIYKINPTAVLGMGGFATGPGGIAAWILRKPLIIHEQNAVAGLTNQYLSRIADQVFEAFPNTFALRVGAELTGNPVRKELYNISPPEERFQERQQRQEGVDTSLRLLILGGSRGAKALNEISSRSINKIPVGDRPEIWHQAGRGNEADTQAKYQELGISAKVEPFIDNMAAAYQWADIVLCRAGALTVSELAAVGIGSILVPFPYAVDDHQTHNAIYLVNGNAALLCQQANLTEDKLAEILMDFSRNRKKVRDLAQNARALSKRDAVDKVVSAFLKVESQNRVSEIIAK